MALKFTENEYFEKVSALEQFDPQHLLLRLLKAKHDGFNEIYLISALKKYCGDKKEKPVLKKEVKPIETQTDEIEPDYKAHCIHKMRELISGVRKLSNSFWAIQKNAAACKSVSSQILAYENEIEDYRDKIQYFNQYNVPRPEVEKPSDALDLPTSKFDLQKKIQTIRVMVSQVQKEIENAALKGDETKVKEREQRLLTLKNLKDVAETKLGQATF